MKRLSVILAAAAIFIVAGCSSNSSQATPTEASTSGPDAKSPDASPPAGASPTTVPIPTKAPPPKQSPGDAVKAQLTMRDKGQYGPEWDLLLPAQQALVGRDLYMKCAKENLGGTGISEVKILDTYTETVAIPGTSLRLDSTAVSISLTVTRGSQSLPQKATFHVFDVGDGRWHWALPNPADYAAGKCP